MWVEQGESLEALKTGGEARGLSHNLLGVYKVMGYWELVRVWWNGGAERRRIFL